MCYNPIIPCAQAHALLYTHHMTLPGIPGTTQEVSEYTKFIHPQHTHITLNVRRHWRNAKVMQKGRLPGIAQ